VIGSNTYTRFVLALKTKIIIRTIQREYGG
jgi:hypothetical protein